MERERKNVQETAWKGSHHTNVPITLLFITRSIGHHACWPACTKVPNYKPGSHSSLPVAVLRSKPSASLRYLYLYFF